MGVVGYIIIYWSNDIGNSWPFHLPLFGRAPTGFYHLNPLFKTVKNTLFSLKFAARDFFFLLFYFFITFIFYFSLVTNNTIFLHFSVHLYVSVSCCTTLNMFSLFKYISYLRVVGGDTIMHQRRSNA